VPEPTLIHTADTYLGWHRPLASLPRGQWAARPQLLLRAGVMSGVARVSAYALLPSDGEVPHPVTLIEARWRSDSTTPFELLTAASKGLVLWLEGYNQS
jgi:hypothetical protein